MQLYFITTGVHAGEVNGCYGNTIEIVCSLGERINILGDFYGLSSATPQQCTYTENDVCVVPTYGHTSVAKQVCNGRSSCIFTVSQRKSCIKGGEKTNYQQIKYECLKGEIPPPYL